MRLADNQSVVRGVPSGVRSLRDKVSAESAGLGGDRHGRWPVKRRAVSVQRRPEYRLITHPAYPFGVSAAVAEAGDMPDEHLVRAEGVTVGYLVDPSGTWSIGSWTVHDCQLFWPGAAADRRVVSRRKNNRVPLLTGVHHVAVPTTDPLAGSDWYVRVFDFAAVLIAERESGGGRAAAASVRCPSAIGAHCRAAGCMARIPVVRSDCWELHRAAALGRTPHLVRCRTRRCAPGASGLGGDRYRPRPSPYPAPNGRGTQRRRRVGAQPWPDEPPTPIRTADDRARAGTL